MRVKLLFDATQAACNITLFEVMSKIAVSLLGEKGGRSWSSIVALRNPGHLTIWMPGYHHISVFLCICLRALLVGHALK